jgi:hypothetical protein
MGKCRVPMQDQSWVPFRDLKCNHLALAHHKQPCMVRDWNWFVAHDVPFMKSPDERLELWVRRDTIFQPTPVHSISLFSGRATGALGQVWHHLSAYASPLHQPFFLLTNYWSFGSGVTPSFSLYRSAPLAFSLDELLELWVRRDTIFQPIPVRSISLFSRRATGALGQAWHHLSAYTGPLH